MVKGRNTSVLSVRLPDELASRLKAEASNNKQTLSDYMKSVLATYWKQPSAIYNTDDFGNDVEEPPDLEKDPDYWKDNEPKSQVKYPGTPRNAPCPCGALHPDGRPKKYKHCCGRAGNSN